MTTKAENGPAEDGASKAAAAVLAPSEQLPQGTVLVRGYDFETGSVDYNALLASYMTTGFQASNFAKAVDIVNQMIAWRPSAQDLANGMEPQSKCTIFLGYTSNMVSSGMRETIKFLVKNKMVDVIVSSAGGIEEDFIKCLGPTGIGAFNLEGASLRKKGLNRIGNLLVPNDNYCKFEDWIMPIFDQLLDEQKTKGIFFTPSTLIHRLGKEINNEDSIYYWAAKNDIPVFCPAITDGSLGDMLFFHTYKNPGLVIDLVADIRNINRIAINAACSGMIILGGGLIKHHIANANLMRNGADYAVYINTGQEFDGSDSGASPDEAVSWGKIKATGQKVKVSVDATLVFPLLVAQTFAEALHKTPKQ